MSDKAQEDNFAGYINKIVLGGKVYKLQCEIVEVYACKCKHCGAPMELHRGEGTCEYCGTTYTTQFRIEEKD